MLDQRGWATRKGVSVRRVSLADVARAAGVSKGSASFALNGKPGVSEETRARVLAVATELGWTPNAAALALSAGRTGTVGLVMARPRGLRGVEPLFQHFLEGAQDELVDHEVSLLIKVVGSHEAELATFTEWARSARVDGMVVLDLRVADDRPEALRRLGMPCVFLGHPRFTDGQRTVWTDDAAAARDLVTHLAAAGHTRIARVATRHRLAHAALRSEALSAACVDAGLEPLVLREPAGPVSAGPEVTRDLLTGPNPPTAIIYEHDVMAMAGMAVASSLGQLVPEDLSVVAWDESGVSELTHPRITALVHDAHAQSGQAVRLLLRVLAGELAATDEQAPPPRLRARGSTGPARAAEPALSPRGS